MPRETGKQRAFRIPLDHFKRPDAFERWKVRLLLLAMVAAAGWWGSGYLLSRGGDNPQYSRGPVAAVHAAWDQNCTACHEPFQPIVADDWARPYLSKVLGHSSESTAKCQTCHLGPQHHASEKEALACSSCHHDHRGRDASLVRVADSDCTQCHADLASHRKAGVAFDKDTKNAVVRFDKDHPSRSLANDPGKLKFNHKRHLTPGLVLDEKGKGPWTLASIKDPKDRAQYEKWNKDGVIKLDCTACHQLDSADLRASRPGGLPTDFPPVRSSGAYMLPVTYENNCRACHPLTFDRTETLPALTEAIPHHLEPPAVKEFLTRTYTGLAIKSDAELLDRKVNVTPGRPLPGQRPKESAESIKLKTLVDDQVATAEKILYRGGITCGKCHYFDPAEAAIPQKIVPTNVPQVWLQHARFDHAAHRAVDCRSCHAGAETSTDHENVLIPGIATCVQCHAPQGREAGLLVGGARFDCAECHRYHGGDKLSGGIGSDIRGAKERRDIQKFLSGQQ